MKYDFDSILARLRSGVQGTVSTLEGTFAGDLLQSVAAELARIWSQEVDTAAQRGFLATAEGDWLDAVCGDYGITRKSGESDEGLRARALEQVRSRGVRHDKAVSLSGGFCFRTICICGDDNAAGGIRSFAVMLLPQKKKAGAKRADQCDAGCGSQKTGEPGWAPPAAVGPAGIVFMHM